MSDHRPPALPHPILAPAGLEVALTAADVGAFDLLRAVHRAAMREHVARAVGWDDAQQGARLRKHFDPGTLWLVTVPSATGPIGTLSVADDAGARFLSQFYLWPAWQGRGVGGAVLGAVLRDADVRGLGAALRVLKGSPARRLYERHGFRWTGDDLYQDHFTRPVGG